MSVDVLPSRTFRVSMVLGFGCGAGLFALGVGRVFLGDGAVFRSLPSLLFGLWSLGYYGWKGYTGWKGPLLHLDPNEIRWHPAGSRHPQRMLVAEVTGFRWPSPADLWIEGRAGSTLRIPMVGVRKCDRERVREWLSDRWVDGGWLVVHH